MKKTALLIATVLLSMVAIAKDVSAPIKHATVYLSGATLEHELTLPIKAGSNEFVIKGLSPDVNENSIQLAMQSGVVIEQFAFATDYLTMPAASTLRDSLNQALQTKRRVEDAMATLTKMAELLEAGVNASITPNTGSTTERIESQLKYFERRRLEIAQQLAGAESEKAELAARIQALKQQLAQNESQRLPQGVVHVTLNATKAQTIKAKIKYFTQSASWRPSYDLQAASISTPMDIVMKASVQQYTGLDWTNVRLTLSTAAPMSNHSAPELTTWWLHQQQFATRSAKSSNHMLMATAVADTEADELVLGYGYGNTVEDYVETTTSGISQQYDIALPYTILGNGKEQIIALQNEQLKQLEYFYTIVPAKDITAYLTCNISDWARLGWMGAQAQLTFAGTYFGAVELPNSTTEEQITLSLGADPQIAVKREKIEQQSKTTGAQQHISRLYRTTIRNNKTAPVRIMVKDQLPVSSNKQITVMPDKRNTPATSIVNETGMLTYELTLQPGEVREILIGYTIKYPKDWRINL